ncbi:MAG TPA: hypothetical protein VG755_05960 [Nannocystaceae bacterium]|nr:hypothetical protein [Nannocystaceae bacterium]
MHAKTTRDPSRPPTHRHAAKAARRSWTAWLTCLALASSACEVEVGEAPIEDVAVGATDELAQPRTVAAASASCTVLPRAGGTTITLLADAETDDGRIVRQQSVLSTNEGGVTEATEVTLDGAPLLTRNVQMDTATTLVDVQFGASYGGVRSSRFGVERGTLSGDVDGRAIVPTTPDTPPDRLAFADGRAAPSFALEPSVQRAMDDAQLAASDSLGSCVTLALSESGHDSGPVISIECGACWGGCAVAGGGCIAAAAAAASACVFFYAACLAAGLLTCAGLEYACLDQCNSDGGPCCPESCGDVACCADGETCLNSSIGLCCSPGLEPCAGEECCEDTEICIAEGTDAGTCCRAEKKCGNVCCGETESCAEPGLCCAFAQEGCGGGCCGVGEKCIGDGQCCPDDKACGNSCCDTSEGCVDGACKPLCMENEKACDDDNSDSYTCCKLDDTCTGEKGICCPGDQIFCKGGCNIPDDCIG